MSAAQAVDDGSGVPGDDIADEFPHAVDPNGHMRLMCRYAAALRFVAEIRGAGQRAGLTTGASNALYLDRVREELDQELFENDVTLTAAMDRVRRRRLEVQYAHLPGATHRTPQNSSGVRRHIRDFDGAGGGGGPAKRVRFSGGSSSGGGGGGKGGSRPHGRGDRRLCFAWARREVDGSAPGCAQRAGECTFRHSWLSGEEKAKQAKRYGA